MNYEYYTFLLIFFLYGNFILDACKYNKVFIYTKDNTQELYVIKWASRDY